MNNNTYEYKESQQLKYNNNLTNERDIYYSGIVNEFGNVSGNTSVYVNKEMGEGNMNNGFIVERANPYDRKNVSINNKGDYSMDAFNPNNHNNNNNKYTNIFINISSL
ncbi:hypothetical protein PFTANZ_05851, partial [Plasmodium falciparum Tanzania (2000708)]